MAGKSIFICPKETDQSQVVAIGTTTTTTLQQSLTQEELIVGKPKAYGKHWSYLGVALSVLVIIFTLQSTNPIRYLVHWAYRQH